MTKKKKPYVKAALFGAAVVALYALLLTNQDMITEYCTRGRLYALLPIATAFLFSFVHGNFTGMFWTILGVDAKKK